MSALSVAQTPIPYECPSCKKRPMEAKATTPFVRGLIIWFRIGEKIYLGCVGCTRLAVFRETGLSLLIGWFSPFALVINPFMILYGLALGLFVGRNPAATRKYLQGKGLPTGSTGDLQRVCYALAIQMLDGEWTKEAREMRSRERALTRQENLSAGRMASVTEVGKRLVPGFEVSDFEWFAVTNPLEHPLLIAQAAHRILPREEREIVGAFLAEVSTSLEFSESRKATFEAIRRALV